MFSAYLDQVIICGACFKEGLFEWYDNNNSEKLKRLSFQISREESKADDLRREIEREIYENSLIPDSRGDMLGLLETLDKVPNRMESVLREISIMGIAAPRPVLEPLRELTDGCVRCVGEVVAASRMMFGQMKGVREIIERIDKTESECDYIERRSTQLLFESALDLAEKLLYYDVIRRIGSIPDQCEAVGDRLSIVSAKRL